MGGRGSLRGSGPRPRRGRGEGGDEARHPLPVPGRPGRGGGTVLVGPRSVAVLAEGSRAVILPIPGDLVPTVDHGAPVREGQEVLQADLPGGEVVFVERVEAHGDRATVRVRYRVQVECEEAATVRVGDKVERGSPCPRGDPAPLPHGGRRGPEDEGVPPHRAPEGLPLPRGGHQRQALRGRDPPDPQQRPDRGPRGVVLSPQRRGPVGDLPAGGPAAGRGERGDPPRAGGACRGEAAGAPFPGWGHGGRRRGGPHPGGPRAGGGPGDPPGEGRGPRGAADGAAPGVPDPPGERELLRISRAALLRKSWLAAASFERTTKVLADAALRGEDDYLDGLKPCLMVGKRIPVGTGFPGRQASEVESASGGA